MSGYLDILLIPSDQNQIAAVDTDSVLDGLQRALQQERIGSKFLLRTNAAGHLALDLLVLEADKGIPAFYFFVVPGYFAICYAYDEE